MAERGDDSAHEVVEKYFHQWMLSQRSSVNKCFDFLDLGEESKAWPVASPVFVDVGGGTGSQCMALRKKFPDLPGRVILQDLSAVIAQAEVSDGVEAMTQDFFKPQPITSTSVTHPSTSEQVSIDDYEQGAKYYYLRAILHDYPDEKCLEILKHIANAMTEDSALLLDEIVVPNEKVEWYVTQVDLRMLTHFCSMERTEAQWRELLAQAGLKVQSIMVYTELYKLSIIRAVK